jgi:hypothetical protein
MTDILKKNPDQKLEKTNSVSIAQNTITTLHIQNTALANKVVSLKRKLAESLKRCEELSSSNENSYKNMETVKNGWTKFFDDIKFWKNLLKIPAEGKLNMNLEAIETFIKENLGYLNMGSDHKLFEVNAREVFTNISKVFSDTLSEYKLLSDKDPNANTMVDESLERLNTKIEELAKHNQSLLDDNHKLMNQLTEMTNYSAVEKITLAQEKIQQLEYTNENLNRRLQTLLKSTIKIQEATLELNESEDDLEYPCICGGFLLEALIQPVIKLKLFISSDANEGGEKMNEEMNGGNQNGSAMEIEKDKNYIEVKERAQVLERMNEELMQAKVNLIQDAEKNKLGLENLEEKFFDSKMLQHLVQQTQELIKYSMYYKQKVGLIVTSIDEIEKNHGGDMLEVFRKESDEFNKVIDYMRNVFASVQNKSRHLTAKQEQAMKEYDFSVSVSAMKALIDNEASVTSLMKKENEMLRANAKEWNDRLKVSDAKVRELMDLNMNLNQQIIQLRAKMPEGAEWTEVTFRHAKHKEFLGELHNLNKKFDLNIKEKLDDLKVYIKSREDKLDSLESKLRHLNSDLEKAKKQSDQMIQEMELNGKVTDDYVKKYNLINDLSQQKDEAIGRIVKEKFNEQTKFEQDRTVMAQKIEALTELNTKVNVLCTEITKKNTNMQQMTDGMNEELLLQKSIIDEHKLYREALLKRIEELKVEVVLGKNTVENYAQSNEKHIKQTEEYKSKISEKQNQINQKLERTKNLSPGVALTVDDVEYLKLECSKLRRMVKCANCNFDHEKEVILAKCLHTFCKKCMDKNVEVRNRKCPKCRQNFSKDDVKKIYWE